MALAGCFSLFGGCLPEGARDNEQACQVYFTSEQESVALYHGDTLIASTPATLKVAPGEHLFIARKSGYEEVRVTLLARAGERIPVELKLEPLRGLLLLHSQPEAADVECNQVNYGKTPLFLPNFPLGKHQIRFSAPGHIPKTHEIEIADRTPLWLKVDLAPDAARLELSSQPQGASIRLDGTELGVTPYTQPRLPAGQHALELALAGYSPYREEFSIQAGEKHTVNAKLMPLPGKISVQTVPAGARIYVNGQYRGDSPVNLDDLVPAEYVVRAELKGYAEVILTNTLEKGGELLFDLKLERASGTILLTTEPAGVAVFLNGESFGVTAERDSERISEQMKLDFIPPGRQTLQLTRQGYYDVNLTYMISAGQTEIAHEKMRLRPVDFVPNILIRTGEGPAFTFRGVVRERYGNGDIKVEVEPGIFKTFRAAEIIAEEPLKTP